MKQMFYRWFFIKQMTTRSSGSFCSDLCLTQTQIISERWEHKDYLSKDYRNWIIAFRQNHVQCQDNHRNKCVALRAKFLRCLCLKHKMSVLLKLMLRNLSVTCSGIIQEKSSIWVLTESLSQFGYVQNKRLCWNIQSEKNSNCTNLLTNRM